MLCEKCKTREANIRYTEVINGIKTEHNLCSQCAKEMDFGQYSAMFDTDNPIGKMLSELLGFTPEQVEDGEPMDQIECPACHTSYHDFAEGSRFGCPDCYNVFDLLISDKIKQLQGSDTHTGKQPRFGYSQKLQEPEDGQAAIEQEIAILESRLKEAIAEEEYELAAKYRDEIKVLRERMKTDV